MNCGLHRKRRNFLLSGVIVSLQAAGHLRYVVGGEYDEDSAGSVYISVHDSCENKLQVP
jgi:hypothetical protein